MSISDSVAPLTVSEAGESEVLARILKALSRETTSGAQHVLVGPGDDSAVLALAGDCVVSSDSMVDKHDFRLDWSTGFELGWKLAATNLADVAAMGATPLSLTVSVLAPGELPVSVLEEVALGLSTACDTLAPGCQVTGGDLASAAQFSLVATVIGETRELTPVLRSGARAGDTVAYAGELGVAARGLSLLYATTDSQDAQSRAISELWLSHPDEMAAQLAPSPPISLGPLAARAGATAMMDVSDSLSLDASRLAKASNVDINLRSDAILNCTSQEAETVSKQARAEALSFALGGGEDHGFLATFPPGASLPKGFTPIGDAAPGGGALRVDGVVFEPRGWDALKHRSIV